MRFLLITILILLTSLNVFGQASDDSTSVFRQIHVLPKFPGGIDSLNAFIQRNLKCPASFTSEGMVIIAFTVETDGSLTNASYSKRLTPGCDEEALRVFHLMPKWIPATEFEKRIKNNYYVHFRFKCN